jgi:fructose-specific phosphotransferase system component IIB
MIEKKIPRARREQLAVLADSRGVIAVQDIGMDVSRRAKGKRVLQIAIKERQA